MQANILKVVYISIISMLFQAISNTELGILSQFTSQNGNQWAGPLSISMIFLGSGIGSLYNRYINQYRYRYILFIGSLGWTLFIGLIVLFLHIGFSTVVEVCLIIGSFVSGLLVSVFYNSIFNYVNECTRQDKQQSKYFGINMSLTQTSNIVGNVASALLIAPLTQNVYAIVMNVVIFLISLGFIPVKNITKLQQRSSLITIDSQSPQKQTSDIVSTLKPTSIAKPPLSMIFCFGFSGVMISFIYSEISLIFYRFFPDMEKQELNRLTFIAFIVEGVGQFLGGLLVILFESKIKSLSAVFIMNSKIFLAGSLVIYFGGLYTNFPVITIGCFIVGVCDCLGFTLAISIAGRWLQKGYSLFNLGQSGTVAIIVMLHIYLEFPYLLIIYVGVHCLSLLGLLINKQTVDSKKQ